MMKYSAIIKNLCICIALISGSSLGILQTHWYLNKQERKNSSPIDESIDLVNILNNQEDLNKTISSIEEAKNNLSNTELKDRHERMDVIEKSIQTISDKKGDKNQGDIKAKNENKNTEDIIENNKKDIYDVKKQATGAAKELKKLKDNLQRITDDLQTKAAVIEIYKTHIAYKMEIVAVQNALINEKSVKAEELQRQTQYVFAAENTYQTIMSSMQIERNRRTETEIQMSQSGISSEEHQRLNDLNYALWHSSNMFFAQAKWYSKHIYDLKQKLSKELLEEAKLNQEITQHEEKRSIALKRISDFQQSSHEIAEAIKIKKQLQKELKKTKDQLELNQNNLLQQQLKLTEQQTELIKKNQRQ